MARGCKAGVLEVGELDHVVMHLEVQHRQQHVGHVVVLIVGKCQDIERPTRLRQAIQLGGGDRRLPRHGGLRMAPIASDARQSTPHPAQCF